jgi:deoxyribodipyrimidine photolyase
MKIVWLKNDLRTYDHNPLTESFRRGKTIGLFIFEREWLESAEFDFAHLKFAIKCIQELKLNLKLNLKISTKSLMDSERMTFMNLILMLSARAK